MASLRILLVDDEPDFLELMKTRISGWGYEVVTAGTGTQALEVFKKDSPGIVILDYRMPDMDGMTALKEIHKIAPGMPVIMFTAHPDIAAQQDAKKLGVSAFIPKLSAYQDVPAALKSAIDIIIKSGKAK